MDLNVSISIHALREEGDRYPDAACVLLLRFLSTPSARRATILDALCAIDPNDFYPRPPRGGRLVTGHLAAAFCQFLSTPSARRATCLAVLVQHGLEISIHALREEGDEAALVLALAILTISIHALREEGDVFQCHGLIAGHEFLSTPSARRATIFPQRANVRAGISIHALREEGDRRIGGVVPDDADFYPRPPRGGRPSTSLLALTQREFLSTPSARRATHRPAQG